MAFHRSETEFEGLYIIRPDVFGDARGFFTELYNQKSFEAIGLGHLNFVQDNLSSSSKGIIRGLHFQEAPYAQGKLILVCNTLDLVEVAYEFSTDNTEKTQQWINSGKLLRDFKGEEEYISLSSNLPVTGFLIFSFLIRALIC